MAKKILITGGTGFLGSYVVKLLLKANHNITVVKRSTSDISRLKNLNLNYLDLDKDNIENIFSEKKFNIIIHVATSYGRRGENYDQVKSVNYDLPLKLLKLSLGNNVDCFINTDTFFELDPNPEQKDRAYIQTKKEFLSEAKKLINNGEKTKFINLRIEHIYGPNDNPTKFVPFLLRELKAGHTIDFNEGLQKRDFTYVEDAAEAYLEVLKNLDHLDKYEEFGIGTGQPHTIKDFTLEFQRQLGGKGTIKWGVRPYPIADNMYSKANLSNNMKINWKAKTSIKEGVKKTLYPYNQP